MIRIESHADYESSDLAVPPTIYLGYRVDADGYSASDLFEIDLKAARRALDRYLDDRERLHSTAPPDLTAMMVWKIHGRGRIPINILWKEFHVYFLLTKLRILLSDRPQPVECNDEIDDEVSTAISSLCEEYNVEYSSCHRQSGRDVRCKSDSPIANVSCEICHRVSGALDRIQRWLILLLFSIFRAPVLKMYSNKQSREDVRFWLHRFENHETRLYGTPEELDSRGFQIGYAEYDYSALRYGLISFIKSLTRTISNVFETNPRLPAVWYIHPKEVYSAMKKSTQLSITFEEVATQAKHRANTAEYTFLCHHFENTISANLIFRLMLIEPSIRNFAKSVRDDIWCYSIHPLKRTTRILNHVGESEGITTIAVAPSYFSSRSPAIYYTETEITGPESLSQPNMWTVFEKSCSKTLNDTNISTDIQVVRDKIDDETDVDIGQIQTVDPKIPNGHPSTPSDDELTRVLVLLTIPIDNTLIVDAIRAGGNGIRDVIFVFKPHPLFDPDEALFDELDNVRFRVVPSDAPLAELVESCDICISMYSTAAVPALIQGTPVIWAPLGSPNHIRLDLQDKVGIQVNDSEELENAIRRLHRHSSFYVKHANEGIEFAKNELIPPADNPNIADVIEGEIH